MNTLFWPGDHRAGALFTDAALVDALVLVEQAWLDSLVTAGLAPADAARQLKGLVEPGDVDRLGEQSEGGGTPVLPVLRLLRTRLDERGESTAASWLHRGMTSQDVVDTALMLMAREALAEIDSALAEQVTALSVLVGRHRDTPMTGRTLTQAAVPISFGIKAASWLHGLLDAAETLHAVVLPAQFGGAAGNRSGAAALTAGSQVTPAQLAEAAASLLGLHPRPPWQTARGPVTALGDALVGITGAWGHIANDVLTLSRPEIGELAEPMVEGRGGSSTMPQKANPTLSVLIRRAALTAPALGSLLHLAAADARDERPDGAWHIEWQPLQLLVRHAVAAADQTTELLAGLHVDVEAMARNLDAARPGVDAERSSLGGDGPARTADDALVEAALRRAGRWQEARR